MTYKDFLEEWRNSDDFVKVQTSGSTGRPKSIKLAKAFMQQSALRTNKFFDIVSSSHLHSCISPDYIGGKMMAVRADTAGCRLTWEEPSNKPKFTEGEEGKISLLAVVPSQMEHILSDKSLSERIGAVIIGGSAIDGRLREKIVKSGINAFETYGMTETASHIALRKVSRDSEWFEALPGITISLNENGCLCIKFDTCEEVYTNDLATLLDSHHFKIDGRIDHVIVTGGKKVNPFDVEKKISDLIPYPFYISSLPDEKWTNRVILKIESDREIDKEELSARISERVQTWERPKEIKIVKCFERTPNGKIKR